MLATFIVVIILTLLATFIPKKIYESNAQIVMNAKNQQQSMSDELLDMLNFNDQSRTIDTDIEIMQSPDLLDKAFKDLSAKEQKEGFDYDPNDPQFKEKLVPDWAYKIDSKHDTDVITVIVRSHKASVSAHLANLICKEFLDQNRDHENESAHNAAKFVKNQMDQSDSDLKVAQKALADFKRQSGFIAPDSQLDEQTRQLIQMKADAELSHEEADAARKKTAELEAQDRLLSPTVTQYKSVQSDPLFQSTRNEIEQLQAQLGNEQLEFSPKSPEVQSLQKQIKEAGDRLKRVDKQYLAADVRGENPVKESVDTLLAQSQADEVVSEARERGLNEALSGREDEMRKVPQKEYDYEVLQQKVDSFKNTYDLLSDKYHELNITEQSTLAEGWITYNARPPVRADFPRVGLNLIIGTLAGILAALGIGSMAERSDRKIHDSRTAESISGLPVLSAIPDAAGAQKAGQPSTPLLLGEVQQKHPFMEAFRLLRNNVFFASPDKSLRSIAVTSPGKSEGKSTIAVNMAIAIAMDGKSVLLIDADLRRPSIHRFFGISRDVGLTNVIRGQMDMQSAVTKTDRGISVLPSGPLPPDPAEFLNSAASKAFFATLMDQYDVVVVDCPPATGMGDVQIISTLVDGVLVMVTLEQSSQDYLSATMSLLRQSGANVIGLILNRLRAGGRTFGYGYDAYYAYYYGSYYYDYEYAADGSEDQQPGTNLPARRSRRKKSSHK